MKGKFFGSLLLGTLLLAGSAFAANKGSLHLYDTVNIGGQQVKPGEYSLQWEGTGPDVQLSIRNGKNVVATVPARVVELTKAPASDAVGTTKVNGGLALSQIQFGGKKTALEISEATAVAGNTK